ncbi:MAG: putative Ig domain-containing protein, partial [Bryobacteraceae bacterium]
MSTSIRYSAFFAVAVMLTMPNAAFCQTDALSLSSGSGAAGSSVPLNLSLSGTALGAKLASVQFDLTYDPLDFSAISVVPGADSTGASKSITCNLSAGSGMCVVYGLNANSEGDGVVAVVSATLATGSSKTVRSIQVVQQSASNLAGMSVPLTATAGSVQVTITPPPALSTFTCSPTTLASMASSTCTAQLTQAAPIGGAAVVISSNNAALTAPASVTVPAGSLSAAFSATAGSVTISTSAILTASAGGTSRTAAFTITPIPGIAALTCSPSAVLSGGTTTCSVTLSVAASAGGASVALTSNNASVTVPATVAIPAGQTGATFTAALAAITADSTAQLKASLNGTSGTAALTLVAPVLISSLACSPSTVVSGASSTCTVTLSKPASGSGFAVTLSSSGAAITVPVSVTVPAGSSSTTFTAASGSVTTPQPITITATQAGSRATATVIVQPSLAQLSALSCAPTTITGAGSTTCTVSLSSPASSSGASVTLTSNNTSLVVPASVVVASGALSATFAAAASAVTAQTSAQITAAYGGISKAVTVTLQPPAVIAVSAIGCTPTTVVGGAKTNCTVSLQSSAPSGGVVVSLSSSSALVTVPASVTVPSGSSSANFAASASSVTSQQTASITASVAVSSAKVSLTVVPLLVGSFSCTPSSVQPGSSTQCTVSLNAPAPADTTIRVVHYAKVLNAPASVTARAGQSSVVFTVSVVASAKPHAVTITASLGSSSIHATITILAAGTNAPAIRAPGRQTSIDGEPVSFMVSGYDPQDLPISLSAPKLPAGAAFDAASGQFSWEPGTVPAGTYPVEFAATNSAAQTSTVTVPVDVVSGTPKIVKLVNAASRASDGACSPGSMAAVLGVGLGKSASGDDVKISVNSEFAVVTGSSDTEIAFVCPDLPPGTPLSVQARRGARSSNTLTETMAEAAPGIFSLDGTGTGQGMALASASSMVLMHRSPELPSQPAVRRDPISILATGLGSGGVTDPTRLQVSIGEVAVRPESVSVKSPGVWEVLVKIPETAAIGEAVPLRLELTLTDGSIAAGN